MPAHYDFSVRILPNGAHILKIQIDPETGSGVVLGYLSGHVEKFVTWRFSRHDLASTYWGHYFRDRKEAEADYIRRVMEL